MNTAEKAAAIRKECAWYLHEWRYQRERAKEWGSKGYGMIASGIQSVMPTVLAIYEELRTTGDVCASREYFQRKAAETHGEIRKWYAHASDTAWLLMKAFEE